MFNERIKSSILFLLALTAGMFATPATAQDDLYYDPATDAPKPVQVVVVQEQSNNLTQVYSEDGYYEDDYAYEYSSRIRRFHQPTQAVDYYDPLYVDMYYYDPYYAPGTTIYAGGYNDYWQWRSWYRWQYANPYAYGPMYGYNNFGYSPWGWNVGFNVGIGFGFNYGWGYPAWGYPVYNNYYYDPYWVHNGYNPYYYPPCGGYYPYNPGYGGGGGYPDGGGYPETYYGPRRGNTSVDPGFQSSAQKYKDGRLAPSPNPNTGDPERVQNTTANGRKIESDREPATGVERQTSTSKDPGRPTEKPATVTPGRRPQTETEVQSKAPSRRPQTETDVRPTSPTTRPQTEPNVRPTSPTTRPQTDSKQPTNVEPARRPQTETEVRPTTPVRRPEREVEKAISNPDRRPAQNTKQPTNAEPSSRPQTESREVRPSRRPESAPAQQGTQQRSTRPSGNSSNTRERSNDDTPANARPSRSESRSESRSYDRPSSPSTRSNDSGSSGRSSGSSNSGGSSGRSSSGGGSTRSGGRN